jgi:hypothetical protein
MNPAFCPTQCESGQGLLQHNPDLFSIFHPFRLFDQENTHDI